MTQILDGIAAWLAGLGIHPVLGALVAGAVIGLVVRTHRAGTGAVAERTVRFEPVSGALTVDGHPVTLEPALLATLRDDVRGGRLIAAIKLVRTKTGLGLREAKLLVDALARSATAG